VQARLVDANGKDAPQGEVGEIAIRSPGNIIGYWDDPNATRDALRDGWLYSGDLARRDTDGYYWFEGRKKEIIVRGGSNISPQEVEEAIHDHPAVLEAGVVGMPDPFHGERVVAFVSLREGHVASEQELREHSRHRLADYQVPEKIVFLSDLPKGLTGKVQRRLLKTLPSTLDCQTAEILQRCA
jgi:long-chain acyl-CoA synthetase